MPVTMGGLKSYIKKEKGGGSDKKAAAKIDKAAAPPVKKASGKPCPTCGGSGIMGGNAKTKSLSALGGGGGESLLDSEG